ncbi:MAG: VWA domain-containing protein [Gammaproteobacteria bacterium]|nr:VWA domain-containing protein [Gammaproteobacteria bacterium]MBT3722497.1 VWA domain-containing protein [Gammaproteobacteria bacterium]MBT4076903.1 VWA domain-containing protein [Gammaproteobacteria bacterium]MBT4196722.1 VWA domain-containing protein [Gammaproteobacteria bacterium]MBT4448535.1 VWA domain-containing protein [Gammaproteobacteria bacterium]
MFELEWPLALLFLPLPVLVWYFMPATGTQQQAALRVPFMQDFEALNSSFQKTKANIWLNSLLVLCWILLVLATARPLWVGEQIELPISGRDLMLAVDLSGSMQVEDFRIKGQAVDRLTATKYVAKDFIRDREGDRLGLILFGRNAYLQTPLTFDLTTVNTLLMESAIGLAGKETAIGDAIGLAIKRLKDKKDGSRVLILLTDGANTAGEISPLKAAELAANHGLKIYTIGIGADEMVRESFFGRQRINPSQDLDEETLTAIAEQTGGQYFRARDTDELAEIYKILDELEPVEVDTQTLRPEKSLYMWPLGAALLLAMFIAFIRLTGRGK